ncbi:M23 family metallopeptidase [Cryobacterium sp. MLB-32]|uniref:M23 family metallopeptidase n=1 Tax=Cryobacterium sp. MLB-32 TaxID=1529318 RepID=UPI0009DDE060|nr:M23 family metallopeptidase [Cryobacterium sp. MLB-32]
MATVIGRDLRGVRARTRQNRRPSRRRTISVAGGVAALALLVTLFSPVGAAQALDYPSWQDLQNAKSNTVAAAAQVTKIQELLVSLQSQVDQTQAEADARGAALEEAQQKFDDAARRASELQAQADASKATADAATRQAGQLAAQLYRTGGTDLSMNLFLEGGGNGGQADELLSKLGNMSKLVERSTSIYDLAQAANNSAQALGDQAKVAQAERETLRIAAETALKAAQDAADAASAALAESQAKSLELDQQLAFMRDAEATTSAAYEAGVVERARIAAEAARVAAAARAAEAARAAAAAAASGGSSSAGSSAGSGSTSGWGRPAYGRITGGYGPRTPYCGNGVCSGDYHYGTDLGTGCGAPIYAAHSGRVTWAGRLGTYGNFVKIDHGDGVSTGYAHIRDGGIFVSAGQNVSQGQNIASSGSTGASTACHLHFEVWIDGNRVNAVPFMADRGAALG